VTGHHRILRAQWCDITVLNVYAPTEDKCDNTMDSFSKELQCAYSQLKSTT